MIGVKKMEKFFIAFLDEIGHLEGRPIQTQEV